ncbi:MAG: PilX N-terminal domain-containing pilus assembly protein [Burkholderiales bacterium]
MNDLRSKVAGRQRGATLLVVLVMLVVLTLFAVAVINLSSMNAKAVGNMQQRKNAEIVAQGAVEQVLNTSANFYARTAPVTVSTPTGFAISVGNRVCVASTAATGFSLVQQIVPEDTFWEFQVTVSDSVSGANTVVHQGAKIRMLANNCAL